MNWNAVVLYLARALALLTAIPVHEAAHAWIASRLGDSTAKNLGRMSLNPLRHIDPLGALCMVIAGFGWAKPVPIMNYNRFLHYRRDLVILAAAGPIANLLMAYCLTVLYKLTFFTQASLFATWFVQEVILEMIEVNVTLTVFNLLPIPPLDGSQIVGALLPYKCWYWVLPFQKYFILGLLVLVFLGVFQMPLQILCTWVLRFLDSATGFLNVLYNILC